MTSSTTTPLTSIPRCVPGPIAISASPVEDLMGRGLPNIQDRLALQMVRPDRRRRGRGSGVHQRRQRPARLGGQRLPMRRPRRLDIARIGGQIELIRGELARHGHLPDSRRESPMLRSNLAFAMGARSGCYILQRVAETRSATISTWEAAPICKAALAARSNIQARIFSHRSDPRPERLQRKTSLPAFFSTTS